MSVRSANSRCTRDWPMRNKSLELSVIPCRSTRKYLATCLACRARHHRDPSSCDGAESCAFHGHRPHAGSSCFSPCAFRPRTRRSHGIHPFRGKHGSLEGAFLLFPPPRLGRIAQHGYHALNWSKHLPLGEYAFLEGRTCRIVRHRCE